MNIELITIDFWNTLFDSSNGKERNNYRSSFLKETLKNLGIEKEPLYYENAIKSSWEYFNNIWKCCHRTPLTIEMIEYFWNLLDLPKDDDSMLSVEKAFSECLLEFPPNLITGVRDALELLKPDYKLAIVSDTGFSPGKVLRQLMINENVFDYFSYFSFSDETGVSKPDPLAFSTVIEACGIAPENCAHIGDIESTDIAGAKNLGMKAIRFTGDPTTKFAVNGELPSKADAVMDSWQGIVKYIKELN